MKKLLAILLALTMLALVFTACKEVPADVSSDIISSEPEEDPYIEEPWEEIPEEEIPESNLSAVQLRANNIQMGEDQEYIQACLVKDKNGKVSGNNYRLKQFIKKVYANKDVNVVFFGGQNVGVDGGYTDKFIAWLDSETTGYISSYEASFPGITSDDAIFRVKHDIVDRDPDIVFLDMTVQDAFGGGAKNRAVYFENMVRKVLEETDAAVVIISNAAAEVNSYRQNNSNPDPMITAAEYHKAIAEHYDVAYVDFHNATWDIVSLLVDKKPYGQIPVCSWPIFGESNTDLSDVGHKNLSEALIALIENVKAETKTDAKPSYGSKTNVNTYLYKNNSYMNFDYMDVMDIYYSTDVVGMGKLKNNAGYSLENLKGASLAQWSKAADHNGTSQFFQAFRPLLSAADADIKESAPIIINMPEVTKTNKAYLHVAFDPVTSGSQTIPFSMFRYTCYDKNGKVIGGEGKRSLTKPSWTETPTNWTYNGNVIELREGTVKVVFEIYCPAGYIRLYGVSRTQTITGRTNVNY